MKSVHQQYLLKTLALAKKRAGFCAPNPAVGAIVVKAGRIIAEGFHWGAGHAHAEVHALNDAGESAKGADLYVSLEPCCHFGRTPPCTEKIKAAGISRVFFAFLDPNPKVSGKGCVALKAAGICCEQIEVPEVNQFYQPYAHWTLNHKPFVVAKIAMTADGFVSYADGTPKQITGSECYRLTHQCRLQSDAILTTAKTIIADDPQMNVRFANAPLKKPLYVMDSQACLPLNAKVHESAQSIILFHSESCNKEKIFLLKKAGVQCISVSEINEKLALEEILNHIGKAGVQSLWIESGPTCFQAFASAKLVQQLMVYVSSHPLNASGLPANIDLKSLEATAKSMQKQQLGDDCVYIFHL